MTYYQSPTTIHHKIGNNTFAYNERVDVFGKAEIVVPMMVEGMLDDVKIGKLISFAEVEKGEVRKYVGLERLVRILTSFGTRPELQRGSTPGVQGNEVKNIHNPLYPSLHSGGQMPIYIVDNHNHALYCWYREFLAGRFEKGIKLIHIDQHSDMKEPVGWIDGERENDLNYIAQYTNEVCTIADFIQPALRTGLVGECVQVRTEKGLLDFSGIATPLGYNGLVGSPQGYFLASAQGAQGQKYILDIDLDFWAPEMGIVEFEKTIQKTRALIDNACVVTIATSPHFMDQERAIEIIQKILV